MEALKTPFYPTSAIVKNLIEDGAIGQVTGADVNYCYDLKGQTKPGWYILDPLQGGALYDIGSYLYYFVLDLFPDLTPTLTVTAQLRDHIDVHFQCELMTASGARILTEGAIDRERPREAVIRGTEGTLRIPYYYRAEEIILENARGIQTIRPTIQYTDLAGGDCGSLPLCWQRLAGKPALSAGQDPGSAGTDGSNPQPVSPLKSWESKCAKTFVSNPQTIKSFVDSAQRRKKTSPEMVIFFSFCR